MKKTISYILLTVIFVLALGGCGTKETQNYDRTDGTEGTGNPQGAGDDKNPGRQDNSLDAYSAVVRRPLQVEAPANALAGGGSRIFLGDTGAYYFKKHLFENVEECWDELSCVTVEGQKVSQRFDRENQVWDVGPVAGLDHYVTFEAETLEGEEYRYFLMERDGNHEPLGEFPLNFPGESDFSQVIMSLSCFAVDHSGVVHLVRHTQEAWQYLLVSKDGEILVEYVMEEGNIGGLVPLYDGRVAFWTTNGNGIGASLQMSLQYMDAETGRPVLLAAPEEDVYCLTLLDENTLLYADPEGVYHSGLSGKNPELLYRWIDHGIAVQEVPAIQADEEGKISLLYKDAEKYHYLRLEPTTEEVEICEITMAVSPMRMSSYQPLVVAFNKQYPGYHITLKSDYEQTALLTELIAGNGPVLLDTRLTGFEEQEKLWEPLDTIMEQSGMMEELQTSVLEMGKINGTLYGIVTDFRLRTLVTGDPDLKDWDYAAFLQCIEDRPELEAIFNFYGGDYGGYFIMSILSHGLEDAYFLDGETGTTDFDSREFRRVLELAKRYCVREEGVSPGRSLLEGKVLCNELNINKPEDLALYRVCYGQDANYIGYPTKDGSTHFLESGGSPLAVRRTATQEEKEVAFAFISLCLSYEGQSQAAKDLNFGLSVRRDVLEEQIAAMNEDTMVYVSGFDGITLGNDLDIERDRKTLLDMVATARPLKYFPVELRSIMFEELEQYFSGAISQDMVIDHLESRVGVYLGERNYKQ